MAGRHKAFNESTVVRQALEVFWTKGYEATSTQDLLTAMRLNKGSLYNTFKSKRDLYITAIDAYAKDSLSKLKSDIEKSETPVKVIEDFLYAACEPCDEVEDNKGCFLVNAVTEMASLDKELATKAAQKLEQVEQLFLKAIKLGVKNNQLKLTAPPEVLSKYLINIWNGISMTRKMYKDKSDLRQIIALALKGI